MRLGVKGRYAVTAMVDLSGQPEGRLVTLSDIAHRQNLPLAYLEQLFVKLRRAGLVESTRGPQGGYRLAKERQSIRIEDIICAVEEGLTFTACSTRKGCLNPGAKCLTHDLWQGLDNHVRHYLHLHTLDDLSNGRVHASLQSRDMHT